MCYVVAANQAAALRQFPPYGWPGGSMVVDYDARILAQADSGSGEKVVVGPIDIAGLRKERQRRRGHDLRSHLRSEAHTDLQNARLPRALANDHPLTKDTNDRRIRESRGPKDATGS